MPSRSKKEVETQAQEQNNLRAEPHEFLGMEPPKSPDLLDNVLLVFAHNIPEDAKPYCRLSDGSEYRSDGSEREKMRHLMTFTAERLLLIARHESIFWLNGRLPFVTPRELFVWRLKQYVEHIWAFQLPDDNDLAMIFNTTKLRAAYFTADFIARFRKALLFPLAIRRLYRILRGEDENYPIIEPNFEYKKAYGQTFRVPSHRYVQDANLLIDEFRLRYQGLDILRDAVSLKKEEPMMWVSHNVIDIAKDNAIRAELLRLYKIPKDSGYEG